MNKKGIQYLVAAVTVIVAASISQAAKIPTGEVNLNLQPTNAALATASLVKWRTGVPNQDPQATNTLSFAYFSSSGTVSYPTRANSNDGTCNDQSSCWSDVAVKVTYTKPNVLGSAVLMYTNNTSTEGDPLNDVSLRGGLVGGAGGPADASNPSRGYVIPLLWKAIRVAALKAASGASISAGGSKLPATSPLYMPKLIDDPDTDKSCPADGPYKAIPAGRSTIGFCDFSVHFFTDPNNTDPQNLFFNNPDNPNRSGSFNYASIVNLYGAVTLEGGNGGFIEPAAHFVIGANFKNAPVSKYSSDIFINAVNINDATVPNS